MRTVSRIASEASVRLVQALVCSHPPRCIPAMAALAGTLWYVLDSRHRRRVHENLRVVLPESGAGRAHRRLARAIFRNMARVPIEALFFERLLATPSQLHRRLTYHGPWPTGSARDEQPSGVVFIGHLGNWELAALATRRRLGPVRTVVRTVRNPVLDAFLTRTRGGEGAIVRKGGAYPALRRALRQGAWVLIAGDQNAGSRGRFVPFFGLPARTHETPARLALHERVPLDVVTAVRRTRGVLRFDVYRERVVDPAGDEAGQRSVRGVTAELNARLETWIRRTPEQYNFLHRRWKERPPGEPTQRPLPRYDHRGDRLLKGWVPRARVRVAAPTRPRRS